jgi:hypothetical protein
MKTYHQVQLEATAAASFSIADADHNSAPTKVHAHCPIVVPPGPMLAFESDRA